MQTVENIENLGNNPNTPIQSDIPPIIPNPPTEAYLAWKAELATQKAEELQRVIERAKHIFHCFDGKKYPTYEDFNPVDPREEALGYGGAAKKLGFKVALVAQWIKENEKFKTDISTGILYFNNGKTWIANAEPYLEHIVNLILGKDAKAAHYRNIEFTLKALTYEKIEFSAKLACENGLLNLDTLEFKEYGPETANEMPFFFIPITYDPNAKCPNWETFVNQVVYTDDLPMLQEWSGYCLYPNYKYHKIMWIIGSGRNGKGVWQRTIQAILGLENVSSIGLEEFDGTKQFSMSQLYGKLANFCSEPRATNQKGESITLNTTLLKKATGSDTIDAEIKNKQKRLQFTNCAKITVLANRLPRINDQTTAFKERRLFLKFPFEFTGEKQIANVENKWLVETNEKSGILNWMITGLQRLLTNGTFTNSKSQQIVELEFLRATDNIAAFISETAIYDRHVSTPRSTALELYREYCDVYELDSENDKRFTAALKQTPHIKDGVTRINGKQERAWLGVAFRKIELKDTTEDEYTPVYSQPTLESVTPVTDVTRPLVPQNFEEVSKKLEKSEIPVTSVTTVTNTEKCLEIASNLKVCGNCTSFQQPCCCYPGDFEKVDESLTWAYSCTSFVFNKNKMSNPGEDA